MREERLNDIDIASLRSEAQRLVFHCLVICS
jgi:hypothetical protein